MRQAPPEGGVWGGVRLANAAEPRTTPVARNATETKQITHDLVFTYDHQGGPRTRMGSVGRDPLLGRRLHRPPGFRGGRRGTPARSRGLPRGDRSPAQLARRPARLPQTGRTAPVFRHFGRLDGLDGQPLHRQPPPAPRRRLHARRQGGIPPRSCRDGLFADPQAPLPPRSGGHRGHRSLAAPPDPLRLLERRAETLHPGRIGRRPADLRHGRTGRAAGGPGDAQRL